MNIYSQITVVRAIFTLAIAAALPSANAGTIEEALKVYDSGQYQEAGKILHADALPSGRVNGMLCELYVRHLIADEKQEAKQVCSAAADAHDPHGLMMFADAHNLDNPPSGIQHDDQSFLRYLAEATELSFPPAFDRFCEYFYSKKMYTQATPFCKFAAASKLPTSMYVMSLMLFEGTGAVQDFDKARQFALASARMNFAPAYKLLGDLSKDGKQGAKKDLVQAYAWYALASSAAPDWAEAPQLRNGLQLNNDQIAQAQKMAGQWSPLSPPKAREFYGAK